MTFLDWQMNPRYAQAPADAPAGSGGEAEEVEEVDADGADEPETPAAGKDEKPAKPAPEKKGAEKPAAKAEKKGKDGASSKPAASKTLLGGKDSPADGADGAAAGKGKPKEGGDDQVEGDLEAWKPQLADGVKVDEELLGEAKTWAKTHGLKGEQLQGIVDLGVKMQQKAAQTLVEAHDTYVEKITAESKADKEIGGAKLADSLKACHAVLTKFGGEDAQALVDELERTGLGSHPKVIRLLTRIEKATRDDDTEERVRGGKDGAKPANPMEKFTKGMYPKMRKELAKERGEDVEDDD